MEGNAAVESGRGGRRDRGRAVRGRGRGRGARSASGSGHQEGPTVGSGVRGGRSSRGRGRGVTRTVGGSEPRHAPTGLGERMFRAVVPDAPVDGRRNLTEPTDAVTLYPLLEEPLNKKKRRNWPPPQQSMAAVPSAAASPAPSVSSDQLDLIDWSDDNVTSPRDLVVGPSHAPLDPSPRPSPAPLPLAFAAGVASSSSAAPSPGSFAAPSLAEYVEITMPPTVSSDASSRLPSRRSTRPPRALRDFKVEYLVNLGSDESDDDDDEVAEAESDRAGVKFDAEDPAEEEPAAEDIVVVPAVGEDVYLPHNLFSFEWKKIPSRHIPPSERRELFVGPPAGPTDSLTTPYDAFVAIWDRALMEEIVRQTNTYAHQILIEFIADPERAPNARLLRWKDTNVEEMYVYFAVVLGTGMCVKSDIKEYFFKPNSLDMPCFSQYMTYARYSLLNKCLHFVDNTTLQSNRPRSEAKIAKIRPIVDALNRRFQELYNLNQNIVIDESLTQWKGSLDIKQFIANKAASVGIKTFELSESDTGYLWRFEVCTGKHEVDPAVEVTPISGVIPSVVRRLVDGLHHRGHTLWMDNYYNSPALARYLKSVGIDCVGTLRTNRQFVPAELSSLTKDMRLGEICGFTSGDVDVFAFRDKNKVPMISTYHGVAVAAREGTVVSKPIAILDYNVRMGGVDKKDQMLAMYPIERKRTKVWYKKFFRRLLNVSVNNCLVLHRQSRVPDLVKDHRKFRHALIDQILEHNAPHRSSNLFEPVRTLQLSHDRSRAMFAVGAINHFPTLMEFDVNLKRHMRKKCTLCPKKTTTYCPGCNVALCSFTCHKDYHGC